MATIEAVYTAVKVVESELQASRVDVLEIKDHVKETNGAVASLQREQYIMEGALGALRIMWVITIGLMGIGVGVAGVVLAVVLGG